MFIGVNTHYSNQERNTMHITKIAPAGAAAIAALTLIAGSANAELVFGVTQDQTLISFDSASPNALNSGVGISGLMSNEQIRGIDFRPADGGLYALGSFNNLYRLNTITGGATLVGAGNFSPGLNGSSFGFDFNPVIDRIRTVSDADQNLVLNPNDGSSTGVTNLFYANGDANFGANPNIVGSAYTNSFFGTTSTQLYGIDAGLDVLVRQANSAGTLETVGSLGVDVTDILGFDISGNSGIAYASVQDELLGRSTFWQIDLDTGAATMVGEIAGGSLVSGIAVVPAPAGAGVLALGGLLAARRRR